MPKNSSNVGYQKSVLVTLADGKRIKQAKQLFSSAYITNWPGDFLLLAYSIPDDKLGWFKKKKIIIKKCLPFVKKIGRRKGVHSGKLDLFKTYIKNWKHVVYLDTDIIVKSPLIGLLRIEGFAAAPEIDYEPLIHQLNLQGKKNQKLFNSICEHLLVNFDLTTLSFNAGVLAFNTKIIKQDTYKELVDLLNKSNSICTRGDQTVLNLFFYKRWTRLPRVYNLQPEVYHSRFGLRYKAINSIVLHFAGDNYTERPWYKKSYYFIEWKTNLERSELIGKNIKSTSILPWSGLKIAAFEVVYYLCRVRKNDYSFSKHFGLLKLKSNYLKHLVKSSHPVLYSALKNTYYKFHPAN